MALHHHPITTVARPDDAYPARLERSPAPPRQLWVQGSAAALAGRFVAIIGSREADEKSGRAADAIAAALIGVSTGVVSGLALGCDRAGHEAALAHGIPTIAVLANGLGAVHPRSHLELAERILHAGGALISEQEPGTEPWPQHLVARNRIVIALARAVVVLQCRDKGGTVHAVRQSVEAGRPVFCVVRDGDRLGSDLLVTLPAAEAVQRLEPLRPLRRKLDALGVDPDRPLARALPAALERWAKGLQEPQAPAPAVEIVQDPLF